MRSVTMAHQRALGNALLVSLLLLVCGSGQGQPRKATVHIRIVDSSGQDIGEPTVTLFRTEGDQQDFGSRFRKGSATGLPFGLYKLRARTKGFWSAERQVRVFQDDVWVVLSLELGVGELPAGPPTYTLSGRLSDLPSVEESVWLRLSGVCSAVVMDARAGGAGDFSMAGIPQGLYVLIVTQDRTVLDVRTVQVPAAGPVDIKLAKGNEVRR